MEVKAVFFLLVSLFVSGYSFRTGEHVVGGQSSGVVVDLEKLNLSSKQDFNKSHSFGSGCQCLKYTCGCCAHVEVPKIYLNDTACMNATYLPKEYGISVLVTLDKWTFLNTTISAKNPPPICFGETFLERYADLCIHFYDLNATRSSVHACVQLIARFKKVVIAQYDMGCFTLGKPNLPFFGIEKRTKKTQEQMNKFMHIPKVFMVGNKNGYKNL